MKVSVKEVGVAQDGICALDTKGNKLPMGEYEVELVWQYLAEDNKWHICNYGREKECANPTRQVYIASVAPESKEVPTLESLSTGKSNWQGKAEARQSAKEQPEKEVDNTARDILYKIIPYTNDFAQVGNFNKLIMAMEQYATYKTSHIKSTHIPIEEANAIKLRNLSLEKQYWLNISNGVKHNNIVIVDTFFAPDEEIEADFFHSKDTNIKRLSSNAVDLFIRLIKQGYTVRFLDDSAKRIVKKLSPPIYDKYYSLIKPQ